ncbi:ArsR/SmtB family transcription factor [Pseudonocardia sp. GCM10023141]|uniref:ArsR/SmtB family transcription factor n=1 Tax=Pseudonocardia sp. GCM10023141 TaxID=3252653 RepID=UPI00361DE655
MVIAMRVGERRDRVHVGVSPLAELMACLHVLAEPDHHPESRGWRGGIAAELPDHLRSDLHRFAPLWARYRSRLLFPMDTVLGRTLEDELAQLAVLDDDLFVPLAADAIRGRAMDFPDAAAVAASGNAWVRECEQRSFTRGDLAHALVEDPDRLRHDLVAILARCAAGFFGPDWDRARSTLDTAASAVATRLRHEPMLDVIAALTDAASTRGSTDTVYIDKLQQGECVVDGHGLLLIPSIRARPHVIIKSDARVPKVLHFPVRPPADTEAATQEELRRRLLVLSEPNRWELCRHLINEPITTTELAARTGATKSAVSRHLKALREVRLIDSQKEGRQVFHRLNASVILRLGAEALEGIIR